MIPTYPPVYSIKFAVGVLLTAFGTFWGAEGAGAHWPGGDIAILVLIAATLLASLGMVAILARRHHAAPAIDPPRT